MRYAFFDLDGTITDPKEGIFNSVIYSLEKFGIHIEERESLRKFIGPPLDYSYKNYMGFDDEQAKEAVRLYREYYKDRGIFECTVYDGIPELLKHLHEGGVKVVLATSKPDIFAQRLLEHFNISQYFDFVAGSTIDGERNTKAYVIRYALDNYEGIDASDVVMIGDRKYDYEGAAEFDIPCILVGFGYGEMEELVKCKPYHIVNTVDELQKFLDINLLKR